MMLACQCGAVLRYADPDSIGLCQRCGSRVPNWREQQKLARSMGAKLGWEIRRAKAANAREEEKRGHG